MSIDRSIEPWMRGPLPGIEPLVQPVFHSFQMAREDLEKHTAGLTQHELWHGLNKVASVGFQLRHIAGSVDRLTTYLMNESLTDEHLAALQTEATPGATLGELLGGVDRALAASEAHLITIVPSQMHEPRFIGRKRLPTTVLGLLVHIAEHTQRHVGQAITTAKFVRTL